MPRATVIIGKSVSPSGALPTPADRAVIELGIDRFPEGVEVYCTAPDDAVLCYALAAGASRVEVLSDLEDVQGEWILVGPGSLAETGDWLPAALAEQLGAALVFDVQEIVGFAEQALIVRRDLGAGQRDELAIAGPAVLVFVPQITPRRYISRFRQSAVHVMLKPGRHGGWQNPIGSLVGDWEMVRPRVRRGPAVGGELAAAEDRANSAFGLGADEALTRDDNQPLRADPATCAAHLVRYLKHHGLLPGPMHTADSVPEIAPQTATPVAVPHSSLVVPVGGCATVSTRAPRRQGTVSGERQRRRPRPIEASLRTDAFPPYIARRPRRAGNPAPGRRRGPRRLPIHTTVRLSTWSA